MTPLQTHFGRSEQRPGRPRPTSVRVPRQARADRSGGIQDRALYRCGCGFAFTAAVSTSVGCPHCGTTQAW